MSLLGFDPDGVLSLRIAIRQATEDLDRLSRVARSSTADGADTIVGTAIAAARSSLLDRWLPRLDALSHALIGVRHPLPAAALDPSAPLGFVTVDVTIDDIALRAQQLAASRALIVWQLLGQCDDALVAQLRMVDATYAHLADWLNDHPGPLSAGGYPALLDRLDPYAAAQLLRHLHLGGAALAAACEQALRRWHDGPPIDDGRLQWTDASLAGDNTGDVLFALLAADQAAATTFVLRCADRPEVVLLSARSPQALAALLDAALPAHLAPVTAGAIVRPITQWTFTVGLLTIPFGNPDIADPRPLVAVAATPWLPWFGPRADSFGWNRRDGAEAALAMFADDAGSKALAGALGTWTARLGTEAIVDADGELDQQLLYDMAGTIGLIQRAIHDSALENAAMTRGCIDLVLDAAQATASFIPVAGPVASVAAGMARGLGREGLESTLDRLGLLPPTVEEVDADERARRDQTTAAVATAAVLATVDRLIELGRLPPDAIDVFTGQLHQTDGCRTRAAAEQLRAAIDRLDAAPSDRHLLIGVLNAFVNNGTEEARCDS
ncbi:MAG: hypothetical protein WCP59_03185 [Actinomycetota bacterium]